MMRQMADPDTTLITKLPLLLHYLGCELAQRGNTRAPETGGPAPPLEFPISLKFRGILAAPSPCTPKMDLGPPWKSPVSWPLGDTDFITQYGAARYNTTPFTRAVSFLT